MPGNTAALHQAIAAAGVPIAGLSTEGSENATPDTVSIHFLPTATKAQQDQALALVAAWSWTPLGTAVVIKPSVVVPLTRTVPAKKG